MSYDDFPALTARQQEVLEFIVEKIKSEGYPPSIREIGKAIGLKSTSTVHAHLAALEEKGYIHRDPSKPRTIVVSNVGHKNSREMDEEIIRLPLLGQVAAGIPILAEENIEAYLPVPAEFINSGVQFLLKVKGDSMIDAHIMEGDYILVRQQPDAENGDIVVALIGDEATVKRLYKHSSYMELRPENPSMQPIKTTAAVIFGKVTGLFRNL